MRSIDCTLTVLRSSPRWTSSAMLSFMSESRRLDNRRLKKELRLTLHYPTVREGL